jgi:hypothetical protein
MSPDVITSNGCLGPMRAPLPQLHADVVTGLAVTGTMQGGSMWPRNLKGAR